MSEIRKTFWVGWFLGAWVASAFTSLIWLGMLSL